jgi:hypothetical protein
VRPFRLRVIRLSGSNYSIDLQRRSAADALDVRADGVLCFDVLIQVKNIVGIEAFF